jgi:hypothetical protein
LKIDSLKKEGGIMGEVYWNLSVPRKIREIVGDSVTDLCTFWNTRQPELGNLSPGDLWYTGTKDDRGKVINFIKSALSVEMALMEEGMINPNPESDFDPEYIPQEIRHMTKGVLSDDELVTFWYKTRRFFGITAESMWQGSDKEKDEVRSFLKCFKPRA